MHKHEHPIAFGHDVKPLLRRRHRCVTHCRTVLLLSATRVAASEAVEANGSSGGDDVIDVTVAHPRLSCLRPRPKISVKRLIARRCILSSNHSERAID